MATITPTVDSVGDEVLTTSIIDRSITEIQDIRVSELGSSALCECTALKKVVFGNVQVITSSACAYCSELAFADFHALNTISPQSFYGSGLETLIIRSGSVCTLNNTSAFTKTPIENGTGYIYVPAALVDSYKTATNWSTYADQIRAIEDYPEVCSTAGKVWMQSNITAGSSWEWSAYGNGAWLACNGNYIYYSEDAKTWALKRTGSSGGAAYVGEKWLMSTNSAGIFYSETGSSWTASNVTSGNFTSFAYANGVWVACGQNSLGFYYSTDGGVTWTQSNVTDTQAYSVAYGNDVFVAACNGAGLYYSTDGMTWQQSNIASGNYRKVVFGEEGFVAAGYNASVAYSPDGTTWETNTNAPNLRGLCYGNGVWVYGTYNSGVYYSTDGGATWTTATGDPYMVCDVAYGGRVFVAGANGYASGLYYSLDGATWETTNATTGQFGVFAYGDGKFVAGGQPNGGSGLWYSE